MKAAIYNPYFDTLGGGERYTVGIIKAFLNKKYKVEIQWNDESIIKKLEERFGIALEGVKVVDSVERGDGYDACFWVSDGSIPTLRSRNNILHFQVPFTKVNGKTLINKMKLFRVRHIIVNSGFTKKFIDKEYGVNSKIYYPPVSVKEFSPKRKQNIICYVGRFSSLAQKKRQDVLIDAFKEFYKSSKEWKLVLAGGIEVGNDMVASLKEQSKGIPLEILTSPSFSQIKELMGVSKMFWSASGFGVDEDLDPVSVEHFGITVVEAMAAKAVPLAINKGGHKEIIESQKSGVLWDTKSELIEKSLELSRDSKMLSRYAISAAERSKLFDEKHFYEKMYEII